MLKRQSTRKNLTSIPFCPQVSDQLTLLKATWPELLQLSLLQMGSAALAPLFAQRDTPPEGENSFSSGSSGSPLKSKPSSTTPPPPSAGEQLPTTTTAWRKLCNRLHRLRALQMDSVELVCFKTLLLFNPGGSLFPLIRCTDEVHI